MDAQDIGIAAGVVSTAVGALALLPSWYRREDRRNRWLIAIAGCSIVIAAVVGVTLVFVFSRDPENAGRAGGSDAGVKASLTQAEYQQAAGAVCSNMKEKARRIEELQAQVSAFGISITLEKETVQQLQQLQPPDALKAAHVNAVAKWNRRVVLLESIYSRLPQMSVAEVDAEFVAPEQLAQELASLFEKLGIPECVL